MQRSRINLNKLTKHILQQLQRHAAACGMRSVWNESGKDGNCGLGTVTCAFVVLFIIAVVINKNIDTATQ